MSRWFPKQVVAAVLLTLAGCGTRGEPGAGGAQLPADEPGTVVRSFPDQIVPGTRYLIYLHNQFLETAAPGEAHPQFGAYEYNEILDALADRRLTVIAERREADADPAVWADRTVRQVRRLIGAGVPANAITVVGFSKGGAIAILASAALAEDEVNFVVLGACGRWIELRPDLVPHGRLLSIVEASDELAGSCRPLLDRASAGSVTREIKLELGGGHGAFFTPRQAWIEPTLEWTLGG
jgi:Lipase (class 3)